MNKLILIALILVSAFAFTINDSPIISEEAHRQLKAINWPFTTCGDGKWDITKLTLGSTPARNTNDSIDTVIYSLNPDWKSQRLHHLQKRPLDCQTQRNPTPLRNPPFHWLLRQWRHRRIQVQQLHSIFCPIRNLRTLFPICWQQRRQQWMFGLPIQIVIFGWHFIFKFIFFGIKASILQRISWRSIDVFGQNSWFWIIWLNDFWWIYWFGRIELKNCSIRFGLICYILKLNKENFLKKET